MDSFDLPSLDLRVLDLRPNEATDLSSGERELVVVILSGSCSARFLEQERSWTALGRRADVFDGPATAIYAPRRCTCRLVGDAGGVRVAIVATAAAGDRDPFIVKPEEVQIERRGEGAWFREVHNIIGFDQPADRILIGETFSAGTGVWSGYPPHRHDRDDPPNESRLDELFLIQVRPRSGFGILIRYVEDEYREQATVVHDGDCVSVNAGYHSFVAAGGHQFYYLWALAGEGRELNARVDPRHKWLLLGQQMNATPSE